MSVNTSGGPVVSRVPSPAVRGARKTQAPKVQASSNGHSVSMRLASQVEASEIRFVAPGIPRGMITVVSGRPGEGKSIWTAALAATVSQTEAVIFSNQEDHGSVVRPRLEAAGALLTRCFIPAGPFVLPQDVGLLEKRIKQTGAGLVVLDAAGQHLGPSATNGPGIRKALTPLKSMLERTDCACVFIDHLIKRPSRTGHPLEAFAGAGSGLPAAARFVYVFGRNPNDGEERVLAPVKVNAIRAESSFLYEMQDAAVFTKDGKQIEVGRLLLVNDHGDVDASEVIAFNGGGKASEQVSGVKAAIAAEYLVGVLMFGPRDAKEVADEAKDAGFSWRTLQRAAEKACVQRKRQGFGNGSKVTWALPDSHTALKVAAAVTG